MVMIVCLWLCCCKIQVGSRNSQPSYLEVSKIEFNSGGELGPIYDYILCVSSWLIMYASSWTERTHENASRDLREPIFGEQRCTGCEIHDCASF